MYYLKNDSKPKQSGFVALFSVMILGLSAVFFTIGAMPRVWTRMDSVMQYSKRVQNRLSALSCANMVALEIELLERRGGDDVFVPHEYENLVDGENVCTVQRVELHDEYVNDEYIITTTGRNVQHISKTRVMLETRVGAQNFSIISIRELFD
jgi:hypothetical protein